MPRIPIPYPTLFLLIFFQCALCQKTAAQFPQLSFETITTQNGLSNNNISCLFQDSKGFLWIGTVNGLNKYDGNIFRVFYNEPQNKNSLSGNTIVDMIEDKNGVFWIATRDGGLTRYDPSQIKSRQFTQIKHDANDSTSLPSNRMTALIDFNNDYILIGAENMMLGFVNKKTLQIGYLDIDAYDTICTTIDLKHLQPVSKKNNWIHHIEAENRYIYISFLTPGVVFTLDRKTNTLGVYQKEILALSVPDFKVDGNRIWLSSWNNGLYIQNNQAMQEPSLPVTQKKVLDFNDEVTSIALYDANTLFAATRNSGIYMINTSSMQYERMTHQRTGFHTIASNRVNCMLRDRQNIWWIGTADGLNKYNPVQWQFHAEMISADVDRETTQFSIYEDAKRSIYMCSSDGIYKKSLSDTAFELTRYTFKNTLLQPTAIYPLQDGKYFLTTELGTFWFEPGSERLNIFYPEKTYLFDYDSLVSMNPWDKGSYQVRFFTPDTVEGHPLFIFGVMGWGVGVYDEKEKTYYDLIKLNSKTSIQNNLVRELFQDSQHNLWAGTPEGLYKWKRSIPVSDEFEQFLHDENDTTTLSSDQITGIYEDTYHHLWISTNNGLNEFDGKRFYRYMPAFANSKFMYCLFADHNQNLWTAVPGGFEIFNIPTKTFHFIALPEDSWSLKYPARLLQTVSGEWKYGAGNSLISFYPDSFMVENNFPVIYLTDFSVFDSSLFETGHFDDLTFGHRDNFITIAFSCIQLSQPMSVKYKYQLSGLNNKWIEAGNTGKIIFTSLPPGKYILNVKVTNPQGKWSDAVQLVAFSITPPYWQKWWFYIICIAVLSAMIYGIIKYRENQFLQLHQVRNKIANDLHDDVGSALSTINLYSEVAKMKSPDANEELNQILDKISNTSIEMQENMNLIVWSLQPRNDHFEQMLLRLKLYAMQNLQVKNISVDFQVDEKLNDLKLTPANRRELFLIYKEAIHNILKYAVPSEVRIHFYKNRNDITMEITDNGIGFDTATHYAGNGLHTMTERAKTLYGKLTIHSQPGMGTSVILHFPA